MKTKRAFLVEPRKFEIREVDLPMNDNQILVKNASCGLCTWELNFWKGILRTDCYPYPLGHEFTGTVVEVGKNVKDFKVGDNVACLHGNQGFSDYSVCNQNVSFKLVEGIDPKYALGEPLKCVTTVLQATQPQPGDMAVILGCGPMGQWCIQALSGGYLSGLIAIDIDDAKLELAKQFGATSVINSRKENAVEKLADLTGGLMADFVIEGTGIPALLNQAQDYLKPTGRGRLLLMSSHEEICPEFDFRKAASKAIDLRVPHPRHSLNNLDDMRRAVALINSGTFQIKPLITHEFGLSQIMDAFDTLEHRPAGYAEERTLAEYEVLSVATEQLAQIKSEYPGFEHAYILDVPQAGIRETRHIMGEYLLTIRDILTNKEFDDTIGFSSHPIDISPMPSECRDIEPPKRAWFRIPYRSLIPKGLDNLLVAGRQISCTREASGCTRPTVCCMITGEATGTAAALLRGTNLAARDVDIQLLRSTLKNNNVKC